MKKLIAIIMLVCLGALMFPLFGIESREIEKVTVTGRNEQVEIYLNIVPEKVGEKLVYGFMVAEDHFGIRNDLLGCKDCISRYKGYATMVVTDGESHWWRESVEFLASWSEREYAFLTTTDASRMLNLGNGDYLLTNCLITCLPQNQAVVYFQKGEKIPTISYAALLFENVNLDDPHCWNVTNAKILTSRQGFVPDLSRPGYNISRYVGSPGYYWVSNGWQYMPVGLPTCFSFYKNASQYRITGIFGIRKDNGEFIYGIPPESLFLLDDPTAFLKIAEQTQWLGGWRFDPNSGPGRILLTRTRP